MSHTPPTQSPFKSRSGLVRIFKAFMYSWQGLHSAFKSEAAFRQELAFVLIMAPSAFWITQNLLELVFLLCLLTLILIVEILNSALEALADSITLEQHPLIGKAKDLGSAAVLLTLSLTILIWIAFTIRYFIFIY